MAYSQLLHDEVDSGPALAGGDIYRTYWDASVDGLFAVEVTAQGRFLCAGFNLALATATGLDPRQTHGREAAEYLDGAAAEDLNSLYRECVATGAPVTRTNVLQMPAGVRVYDISMVPVRAAGGRIELLLGRIQDIAGLAPAARTQSAQGLLQDVLGSLDVRLAVLDRAGLIVLANEAWRMSDLDWMAGGHAVGENYLDACSLAATGGDPDAAAVLEALRKAMDGNSPTVSHTYLCGEKVFQMRATRIERASRTWVVVSHDDVTEPYLARREVSDLTERLLDVQEEERRQIALELHDSTSQHLVAVQLGLAVVAQGRATDQTLADMRDELAEAHREIRTLSYLLHPPRLVAERLAATLGQFVDGFQRRTGASVDLILKGGIDEMPYRIQRAVFRVVQEAMANARKHGQARRISVDIARRSDGLRLEISDDGQSAAPGAARGVGIPGMEARIERFGGSLSVRSTDAGTTVSAFIGPEALSGDPDGPRA